MEQIYDESFDIYFGTFFAIAALSLILFINPLMKQGTDALPTNETVYVESEQPLREEQWTGAQVKYLLWDIETVNVPIYVGGVQFNDLNDVRELIQYIYPTTQYRISTQKNEKGIVTSIQFTIS